MTILEDAEVIPHETVQASRMKMRMLEQMAEALEDEAAGLYRRATSFEEDEFLLNQEIEVRQTEISRLMLRLDSLRSERDGVLEKIGSITAEAGGMREELYKIEQYFMFSVLSPAPSEDDCEWEVADFGQGNQLNDASFFRRMTPVESAR